MSHSAFYLSSTSVHRVFFPCIDADHLRIDTVSELNGR